MAGNGNGYKVFAGNSNLPLAQAVCSEQDPALAAGNEDAEAHLAACHFAWTAPPPAHTPEVAADA